MVVISSWAVARMVSREAFSSFKSGSSVSSANAVKHVIQNIAAKTSKNLSIFFIESLLAYDIIIILLYRGEKNNETGEKLII